MSEIDPLSSSSSGITPTPETDAPQSTPLLSDDDVPQDSMSTFSASSSVVTGGLLSVLLEEPSILKFSQAVNSALYEAKQTAFASQEQESILYKDYRENVIRGFPDVMDAFRRALALPSNWKALYDAEDATLDTLNAAISLYNQQVMESQSPPGADTAQLQTMNDAISLYNLGLMTETQFNTAVTNYNNYMNARNAQIAPFRATLDAAYTTYNAEMISYAPQIASLNSDLAAARISTVVPNPPTLATSSQLFPLQSPPPQPIPVPALQRDTFEHAADLNDNPPIPPSVFLTFQATNSAVAGFLASSVSLREKIDSDIAYQEFVKFYLNAKLPNLPRSYINPLPESIMNTPSGEFGTASLASIVVGLSSPSLERILSQGLFSAANQKFIIEFSSGASPGSDIPQQIQLLLIQQLTQAGLFSGKDALKILANKFTELGNNPVAISAALGLSFSGQILQLIASGALRPAILSLLQNAGVKNAEEAADLYNALVNLSLLKIGITLLSQNLNIPQLPTQLLGNLESPPPLPNALPSVADVLANPLSISYLKNELIKQLVNSGELTTTAAQEVINDAIKNALNNSNIQNESELRAAVSQALEEIGIQKDTASKLADLASDFIQAEIRSNYILDTAIKEDSIDRDNLFDTIIRETNLKSDLVTQVINQTAVAKEYYTQRELRDALADRLTTLLSSEDDPIQVQDNVVVVQDEPLPEEDYIPQENNINRNIPSQPIDRRSTTSEERRVDNITQIESNTPATTDRGKILNIATQAVSEQALASANVNPDTSIPIPSLGDLNEQLHTTITNRLSSVLGAPEASDFANQIISNLTGNQQSHVELNNPLSFTRQIQDQIDTVKKYNSETLNKAIQENFVDFQKTNVDLYSFNRKLMDPANNLIYSMWTGIMYQGQGTFPTNFQHALQFTI